MVETGLELTDHVEVDGEAPVDPDKLGRIQLLEQAGQGLFADHPVTTLGPDRGLPVLGLDVEDRVLLQNNRPVVIGQRQARVGPLVLGG